MCKAARPHGRYRHYFHGELRRLLPLRSAPFKDDEEPVHGWPFSAQVSISHSLRGSPDMPRTFRHFTYTSLRAEDFPAGIRYNISRL